MLVAGKPVRDHRRSQSKTVNPRFEFHDQISFEEATQDHLTFLARRRNLRPSEEYRVPTDKEWDGFLGHFERRKVSTGLCGRAYPHLMHPRARQQGVEFDHETAQNQTTLPKSPLARAVSVASTLVGNALPLILWPALRRTCSRRFFTGALFPGEGVDVIENWQVGYRAVHLLSPKWVLPVLTELARGAKGHNELARATGTAHRQLDRVLDRLAQAGLVERVVDVSRQPLRVRYRLSPSGHAAQGPLDELARWWLKYVEPDQETKSSPGDINVS